MKAAKLKGKLISRVKKKFTNINKFCTEKNERTRNVKIKWKTRLNIGYSISIKHRCKNNVSCVTKWKTVFINVH